MALGLAAVVKSERSWLECKGATTFSIRITNTPLSMNNPQHNDTQHCTVNAVTLIDICAQCRFFIVMLDVVILSVIMLRVLAPLKEIVALKG